MREGGSCLPSAQLVWRVLLFTHILVAVLLLVSPQQAIGNSADNRDKDCRVEPKIPLANGGTWYILGTTAGYNKGESMYADCPDGFRGPYVVCLAKASWSELRGSQCPQLSAPPCDNSDTETGADGNCRCVAGFKSVVGSTGQTIQCEGCTGNTYSLPGAAVCTTCPTNTQANPAKTGCQCSPSSGPLPGTSWAGGNLACYMCPAGTFVAVASTRCKPCRGYYQYNGPGASSCFTCSQNSRAKADNTGCECNPGCTADSGGNSLNPTCSCPGNVCEEPKEYTTITRADGTEHSGCYCKAGYVPDPNLIVGCASSYLDATGPGARCLGFAQPYTHPGDTVCRSCQDMDANAVSTVLGLTGMTDPGARTDNCMCADGYVPAPGTSSQQRTLRCVACEPGKHAVAGDAQCSVCPGTTMYSSARASSCLSCLAQTQANAGKSDCECVRGSWSSCVKSGSGWSTVCSCSNTPNAGRRLHSESFHTMDATPMLSTDALGSTTQATISLTQVEASGQDDASGTELERFSAISIPPLLNIGGRPAAALPMQVVWTDWEGRDAIDVATCMSGAMLSAANLSLLLPPAATAGSAYLQQAATGLAATISSHLGLEHSYSGVFTSSMYKGGPRLSARELKAALVKYYDSLILLPSCLRLPVRTAHRLRVALSNVIGMATGTAENAGGALGDFEDEITSMAQLQVKVREVVNEKRPELCVGIEGSSFNLRFIGFGGAVSIPAASPADLWIYAAVAPDGLCSDVPAAK